MSITPEGTSADAPIIAAQAEAVKPRKKIEYIIFGPGIVGNDGTVESWSEVGRTIAFTRDEAEEVATGELPRDEQGGPFVTIAASAWQPREYETETITRRKPKKG